MASSSFPAPHQVKTFKRNNVYLGALISLKQCAHVRLAQPQHWYAVILILVIASTAVIHM